MIHADKKMKKQTFLELSNFSCMSADQFTHHRFSDSHSGSCCVIVKVDATFASGFDIGFYMSPIQRIESLSVPKGHDFSYGNEE